MEESVNEVAAETHVAVFGLHAGGGHLARKAHGAHGGHNRLEALAQSVPNSDGTFTRVYPAGTLAAHVVGYASTQYGTSGIEAAYNDTLKGEKNYATWLDALNSIAGSGSVGNDVTLSINSKVQQAAQNALSGYNGACVVIDPETGAVLAMASAPTYDASDIEKLLAEAGSNPDSSVFYNRATQALYAPGSTFKMVTLAAALEDGVSTEESVYDAPGEMEIGGGKVTNFNDKDYGEITLARATEVSSNTVFAQVGTELGASRLVSAAEEFGFNSDLNFELPTRTSLMPDPKEMTEWETAWAAAGEPVGEHESPAGPQATVLEMALVGCGLANDGLIMQPYLVAGVYNASGERSYSAHPTRLQQAVSAATAERVRSVLEGVVTSGTGTSAAIGGITVAGKTGTSERGDGSDDVWFVGMAPAEDPKVVVAIVLEKGPSGGGAARSQDVMEAALAAQGLL